MICHVIEQFFIAGGVINVEDTPRKTLEGLCGTLLERDKKYFFENKS